MSDQKPENFESLAPEQIITLQDMYDIFDILFYEGARKPTLGRPQDPTKTGKTYEGPLDQFLNEGGNLFLSPDVDQLIRDYHGPDNYQDQ